MANRILIEFGGRVDSIKGHCKELGISYSAVTYRHQKTGEPYEKCLEYYQNRGNVSVLVDFNGKIASIVEHCKNLGLNYHTVLTYKCKHKELTYEQVFNHCLIYKNKRKIKYNKLYEKWHSMLDRCYNPKNIRYARYGGRGIKVCDRWLESYFNFEDDLYKSFLEHVEKFGIKDTTLDRWPNRNGDYELSNIRWATREEQANNKDINIMFPCGQSLHKVCKRIGMNYNTIRGRLRSGWTLEEALLVPIEKHATCIENTIKAQCDKANISINTYRQRRKQGLTHEEALTMPLKKHNYKYYLSTGEPLDLFCKRNNLPCEAIQKRIRRGQSVDEAINRYLERNNINKNNIIY